MTTGREIYKAAKHLQQHFHLLDDAIIYKERQIQEARIQKPTPGPRTNGDVKLMDVKRELIDEVDSSTAPGGLFVMAVDALSYSPMRGQSPSKHGWKICRHLKQHCDIIADAFPAVEDLHRLLIDQNDYLKAILDSPDLAEFMAQGERPLPLQTVQYRLARMGIWVSDKKLKDGVRSGKLSRAINQAGEQCFYMSEIAEIL